MDLLTSKIVSMTLLGVLSLFFGLIPLKIQKRLMQTRDDTSVTEQKRQHRRRKLIVSCLLCFGAGVLMATVFLHMMPETRENLELALAAQNKHQQKQNSFQNHAGLFDPKISGQFVDLNGIKSNASEGIYHVHHYHDSHGGHHDSHGAHHDGQSEHHGHVHKRSAQSGNASDVHIVTSTTDRTSSSPSNLDNNSLLNLKVHTHDHSKNSHAVTDKTHDHIHIFPDHADIFHHHVNLSENFTNGTNLHSDHTKNLADHTNDHSNPTHDQINPTHDHTDHSYDHSRHNHGGTDSNRDLLANINIDSSIFTPVDPILVNPVSQEFSKVPEPLRNDSSTSFVERIAMKGNNTENHSHGDEYHSHTHDDHTHDHSHGHDHDLHLAHLSKDKIVKPANPQDHQSLPYQPIPPEHGAALSDGVEHHQDGHDHVVNERIQDIFLHDINALGDHAHEVHVNNTPDNIYYHNQPHGHDHGPEHHEEAHPYPIAELLICIGFFFIYFVEELMHKVSNICYWSSP